MSNSTNFSCSRLICIINSSLWTGSLFGKKVKKNRQGKGGELVDKALRLLFCPLVIANQTLSARSLSVACIYRNRINFMHECKKGVGRQHTTFTSCPKCFLFQWIFSLAGRLYSGRIYTLTGQIWFFLLVSHWEDVTCILIFCSYCFLLAWFALWCKSIFFDLFWNLNLFIVAK